jgi:LDH2 family malate/lactate/ureidoglycolate dehydrogenase
MNKREVRCIQFNILKEFVKECYESVGVPESEAELVGDLLVRSDLRGIETHGVMRLPIYIQRLEKNFVRKRCHFEILHQKGATAYVDAHGSMGHVVSEQAMNLAIELAQQHGIGWVAVKDSGHFGVTGFFPMMASQKDLIGYICSNSAPMMAPYGGRERIMGNNPLAYAFPAFQYEDIVVDFSCSVVASGRLILMRKKGERIPLGWAVDKDGLPTEDPYEGYEGGGSLAPIGDHKGYGLAVAHEVLTALLTGGKMTKYIKSLYEEDPSGIQGTCHSFMALDPDCFVGRDSFKRGMDDYIREIKESGKAAEIKEIFMPGEIESRTERERLDHGIPLSEATCQELETLADRLQLSSPFREQG